jgi:hypothetical protein
VGTTPQAPLLQVKPEQHSALLEQFVPVALQPPAAAQTPLAQFAVQQSELLEQFVPVALQPPVAVAQTPLAQFAVQQSELFEQFVPVALQPPPVPLLQTLLLQTDVTDAASGALLSQPNLFPCQFIWSQPQPPGIALQLPMRHTPYSHLLILNSAFLTHCRVPPIPLSPQPQVPAGQQLP